MTSYVKVWEEDVIIPTYEIGEPEKYPMFLEKRVYQGSSGKVYPYPTIETIYDEKIDKTYKAVYLENEYLKVMILPELGGRIQRAYDKTNDYDFVYYNQVIKPALVGLTGPWISGGIEFNWPQHHRPTTYSPVDYQLIEHEDGSKSVYINDMDQMYGTKGLAKFTLHKDKSYIEIEGQLYNPTPYPQTFLWWANPAVAVNDHTKSIFPPDVHAVMDHGKRDVSRFPIATGVYYKHDYSEGVDISRYKNIPVPTSYMAEKSDYDFVGGYDFSKEAGILHVADHHISPGKKQWTWGNGDFGVAWDRNLTDEDGPYIELMTGVYTDNQPDFTWLKPFEEKNFKQYFMPYKGVGEVKNATIHGAINLEMMEDGKVLVKAYATSTYNNGKIVLRYNGKSIAERMVTLTPASHYSDIIDTNLIDLDTKRLTLELWSDNKLLVEYTEKEQKIEKLPEPAKATLDPKEVRSNEELYLSGLHLEQYRHATFRPDDYYLEGLKRDSGDSRINNAYGLLLLRRGLFKESIAYFDAAIKRLTERNPNPYNSEPYYNLGLAKYYVDELDDAFDAFFKATWSSEQQEMSYYYLACIATIRNDYDDALLYVNKSLIKNAHNMKARALKSHIFNKQGKYQESLKYGEETLSIDPFEYITRYERSIAYLLINKDEDSQKELELLLSLMRDNSFNYLYVARTYGEFMASEELVSLLNCYQGEDPLVHYYMAYHYGKLDKETYEIKMLEYIDKAEMSTYGYCFPNKIEDIPVLEHAISSKAKNGRAHYYLGNLYYDKQQWELATKLWEEAITLDNTFPIPYRNLALAYYNKYKEIDKAKSMLEEAYLINPKDPRVFLELDQLYKKTGLSYEERLTRYESSLDVIELRDDLYIEYVTLLNLVGEYKKSYELIMKRKFHPWEGGEGKITGAYTMALLNLAKVDIKEGQYEEATDKLTKALTYPENLGEGKLSGTTDNHIHYYLGLAYEGLNLMEQAYLEYELATHGNHLPAGAMYYNDQPADMLLFQGLAFLRLGDRSRGKERFNKLLDYGEQHLYDEVVMDYFAVSLPDFLIFEEDMDSKNKAHCYYLMALSNHGQGNTEKAIEFYNKCLEYDKNHMLSYMYSKELHNSMK